MSKEMSNEEAKIIEEVVNKKEQELEVPDIVKRATKFNEAANLMLLGFKDHMDKIIADLDLPLIFRVNFMLSINNSASTKEEREELAKLYRGKQEKTRVVSATPEMRNNLKL